MTKPTTRKKGFAMITAIFLMSLVTMTLTVLMTTIYGDAQRTQSQTEDAQLRQLLLAGTEFAQLNLPNSVSQLGNIPITLPNSLRDDEASLTIEIQTIHSPSDVELEVDATLPHHKMTNHLHLTRQANRWQITEAHL
jgi:type II secretory pathway pseudopilin PulG